MKEDDEDPANKLIKRLTEIHDEIGGKCEGCGYEAPDSEFFNCEFCGAPICTYCHNMTEDCSFICRDCIKKKGLTADDVQFTEDGAGRSFF
ncbi:MAG: hypothetical protein JW779_06570 [Candidatus Thorarchaeota archaeon]|nr:hypothetical protein [Candidatus Thorarchaeota archaeon]